MAKNVSCIEVRTASGEHLLNLYLHTKTPDSQDYQRDRSSQSNSSNGDSEMTEAQRRYLFRILAERGLEPEKAHERLKQLFHVSTLQDVSKLEASRMIEDLLEDPEKS